MKDLPQKRARRRQMWDITRFELGQRSDNPRPRPRPLRPVIRVVGGLLSMVVVGAFLLMLPWMSQGEAMNWNAAVFTATSALSVTGLSIITPATDLTLAGQIVLLCLIQIGGVGFMVGAVVIFQLLGRRVSLPDRIALTDSLGLLSPQAILNLTRRILFTVLLIELIGALLLWLNWYQELGIWQGLFYAVFHAVSAFCNAGFDLFSGLPEYPAGIPRDNISLLVMSLLIFLGGLGIPVLGDLIMFSRTHNHRISLHSRITLVVVAFLLCLGALGIFLAESRAGGVLANEPLPRQVLMSFFQSISARTAGFVGLPDFSQVSPATEMLLIALMFIGCAPASMGGGITTGTFAALTLTLWGYAKGLPSAQIGRRSLAVGTVRKAAAVLTISLFAVLLSTWLLLMTHDVPLDHALFEVVSAFATCGLTVGFTGDLNIFGQMVIIFMMFWGRLGALTVVVAIAQRRSSQHVTYPEEPILIG
jgi:trk system potassium uptake protein